jgi:two-component system invasion response regulator UvrY
MNILLIDDHSIITTGLWLILNKQYPNSHIDIANSGLSAFDFFKKQDYDLVFLDLNLPDEDSSNILIQILNKNELTKVIIFTMNPEEQYARRFYELGAKGYLNKSATDAEIIKAVNIVLDNKNYISEKFMLKMADDFINKRTNNPFDKLSNREFEITLLLVKGIAINKIAQSMNLHPSTVGTHKAKVFEKIGVDNIISLKESALLFGIIPS